MGVTTGPELRFCVKAPSFRVKAPSFRVKTPSFCTGSQSSTSQGRMLLLDVPVRPLRAPGIDVGHTARPMSAQAKRRYAEAGEHLAAGRLDEATAELVWLWQNIVADGPALVGVRVSFMANQMRGLAKQHPLARDVGRLHRDPLRQLRDQTQRLERLPGLTAHRPELAAQTRTDIGRDADALAVLEEARRLMPGAPLEAAVADALKAARIEATTTD